MGIASLADVSGWALRVCIVSFQKRGNARISVNLVIPIETEWCPMQTGCRAYAPPV
jgi:hypothetical protein